ncbi:hypothetical protein Fmac_025358 [Flemingia macrophylla]|uniref:Uncharacterized protein n=1 Tax=Flemingia macrophylla TaxID=520843 RepID=A0ABD1LTQ7_9FABA
MSTRRGGKDDDIALRLRPISASHRFSSPSLQKEISISTFVAPLLTKPFHTPAAPAPPISPHSLSRPKARPLPHP